jgi:hypothetical protein
MVEGDLEERTGEGGGDGEGSVGGITSMIESVDSSPTDSNDDCRESVSKINIPLTIKARHRGGDILLRIPLITTSSAFFFFPLPFFPLPLCPSTGVGVCCSLSPKTILFLLSPLSLVISPTAEA